jgi:hypothetical protein
MSLNLMLSWPANVELWIVLSYVAAVLAGAKVVEALARTHFRRALGYGQHGFEYVEAHDLYRCPQGEYLSLHSVQQDGLFAVYRAAPASCRECRFKPRCTPNDEGRLIFRSLAAWAETNVGLFHRRISLIMFAASVVVCLAELRRWAGEAGSGWLAGALLVAVVLLMRDLGAIYRKANGVYSNAQRQPEIYHGARTPL